MATTSTGYPTPATIDSVNWAKISESLGAAYSVAGDPDLKVTVTPGVDRTVTIDAGTGWGRGVQDVLSPAVTVQLPVVASGTRWDTVVLRRTWGTSLTTFVGLTGTATQAVAASRLTNPGVQDDQLLALVQITAGQQLPTAVIDLRTWSSKVYRAKSLLAFPNAPLGREVYVDGVRYRRELDATQTLVWDADRPALRSLLRSSAFPVNTSVETPLTTGWTLDSSDAGNADISYSGGVLTVAKAGLYDISVALNFGGINATGSRLVIVRKNGARLCGGGVGGHIAREIATVQHRAFLEGGDTLQLAAYQSSGVAGFVQIADTFWQVAYVSA